MCLGLVVLVTACGQGPPPAAYTFLQHAREASIAREKSAFTARYLEFGNGAVLQLIYSQKPPTAQETTSNLRGPAKTVWTTAGKKTTTCFIGFPKGNQCMDTTHTVQPATLAVESPRFAVQEIDFLETVVLAGTGYVETSRVIDGIPSRCFDGQATANTPMCVSQNGILTQWAIETLVSYSPGSAL